MRSISWKAFASVNGPRFYGLPFNEDTVTLKRIQVEVPERIEIDEITLVPFHAGETLGWNLVE